jgi:hypothetical protein
MHASDGEPDLGGHLARLAAGGAGGAEHAAGAGTRSWRSTHRSAGLSMHTRVLVRILHASESPWSWAGTKLYIYGYSAEYPLFLVEKYHQVFNPPTSTNLDVLHAHIIFTEDSAQHQLMLSPFY